MRDNRMQIALKNAKKMGERYIAPLLYSSKIAGKDMTFILKWITDLESKNRMDGDIFMISTAFKF